MAELTTDWLALGANLAACAVAGRPGQACNVVATFRFLTSDTPRRWGYTIDCWENHMTVYAQPVRRTHGSRSGNRYGHFIR
jgi:hypothetical protein